MKILPAFVTKLVLAIALFFQSFPAVFAQQDSMQNTISLSYEHTHFDKQFANDWQAATLEYKRQTHFGALIGRINRASRFGERGWQFEGEAYPIISKKMYAYTGLSFSNDVPVFARWRTGASLYYNFAKTWEAEGGFRYLNFDRSVWMGSVGISKYAGRWLFNIRSFFSAHSPSENQSFFFKAQRFLKNEMDYIWVQAGSGVSPDESRSIQLNTATSLVSKRINAGAKLSVSRRIQLLLTAGYATDEYKIKTYGNQYNASVGMGYRF